MLKCLRPDQDWIKQSKHFWELINGSRNLRTAKMNGFGMSGCIWPLNCWNQVIKTFRREKLCDQAHFSLIKILISWSNTSAEAREVTTPCTLHLPASTNASCTSESVGSVLEANSLYTLAVRPSSVISDTRTNEIRIGYGVHYLET